MQAGLQDLFQICFFSNKQALRNRVLLLLHHTRTTVWQLPGPQASSIRQPCHDIPPWLAYDLNGCGPMGTPALRLLRKTSCTPVHCVFLIFTSFKIHHFGSTLQINPVHRGFFSHPPTGDGRRLSRLSSPQAPGRMLRHTGDSPMRTFRPESFPRHRYRAPV